VLLQFLSILLSAAAVSVATGSGQAFSSAPNPHESDQSRTLEIRVYTLKPGTRDRFHETVEREAMPLLRRAGIEVVAYGPSVHDEVSYFLARAFRSLAERTRSEEAFYGSAGWQRGPREAIMSAIEHYSTLVVAVSPETIRSFRDSIAGSDVGAALASAAQRASDIASLLALNDEYIRAAQTADVERFKEILAEDFVASLANGSYVNRTAFLAAVSSPATITKLQAHDVDVRLLGGFAIIHARTTFATNDGRAGASRYTDVWAKRGGRWVCVAAQVTSYEPRSDR
jgi:ketosteroid isomerase-like protein